MDYGRILLDEFRNTPAGVTVNLRIDPTSRELFAKFSDGSEKQLTGAAPAGSVNSVDVASITAFQSLVSSSGLTAGTQYRVPFVTKHQIPGTTVINTAASETILILATSTNTYSELVISEQFPDDIIVIDFSDTTAEDGSTARDGKIILRSDKSKEIITPFDFRNVLFRRYAIDMASIADYPSTTAVSQGDIYKLGGKIVRVVRNFTTNATPTISTNDTILLCDTGASFGGIYQSYSQTTLSRGFASLPVDNGDFVDTLCLDVNICERVVIRQNYDDETIYNNVVLGGNQIHQNIEIEANTSNITMGGVNISVKVGVSPSSSNSNFLIQSVERSEIGGNSNITVINSSNVYFEGNSTTVVISDSDSIKLGSQFNALEIQSCSFLETSRATNANTYNGCSHFYQQSGDGNDIRLVTKANISGQCSGNSFDNVDGIETFNSDGNTISDASNVTLLGGSAGNNVTDSTHTYIGSNSAGNTVGSSVSSSTTKIGDSSNSNTIDGNSNVIGNASNGNTILGDSNTIGQSSSGNTIERVGDTLLNNRIMNSCNGNTIEGDGNIIESNSNSNDITGADSDGNVLGYTCNGNDIIGSYNIIGSNCAGNDIIDSGARNEIGSFSNSNEIKGASASNNDNKIGTNCNTNVIQSDGGVAANNNVIEANSNTNTITRGLDCSIGSNCNANQILHSATYSQAIGASIGSSSNSNVLTGVQKITILSNSNSNTLDDCAGVSLGVGSNSNDLDKCNNTDIKNGCDGNTISPSGAYGSAEKITFGNDCNNNTIHGSNVTLDNGCEDIVCDDAVNPMSMFDCYFAPGTHNKEFSSSGGAQAFIQGLSWIIPANTQAETYDIDSFDFTNRVVFASSSLGAGTQQLSIKGDFSSESAIFELLP